MATTDPISRKSRKSLNKKRDSQMSLEKKLWLLDTNSCSKNGEISRSSSRSSSIRSKNSALSRPSSRSSSIKKLPKNGQVEFLGQACLQPYPVSATIPSLEYIKYGYFRCQNTHDLANKSILDTKQHLCLNGIFLGNTGFSARELIILEKYLLDSYVSKSTCSAILVGHYSDTINSWK